MEGVTDRDVFLHLWQRKNLRSDDFDSARKADTIRFNLAQLSLLGKTFSDIKDDAVAGKTKELLREYGQLMDKTEKEGGRNNLADPILTLISNSKNESKSWKCNLNSKDIISKYVKPHSTVNKLPMEEYKHLAVLFNQADEKKYLQPTPDNAIDLEAACPQPMEVQQEQKNSNSHPSSSLMNNNPESLLTRGNREEEAARASNTQAVGPHGSHKYPSTGGRGRGTSGREGMYPWNRDGHAGRGMNENATLFGRGAQPTSHKTVQNSFDVASSGLLRHSHQGSTSGPSLYKQWRSGGDWQNQEEGPSARWRGRGRGKGKYPWTKRNEEFISGEAGQFEMDSQSSCFRTASHQLMLEQHKKGGRGRGVEISSYGSGKRSLGIRRNVTTKFVPPVRREDEEHGSDEMLRRCLPQGSNRGSGTGSGRPEDSPYADLLMDPRLANIEPKMVELIMNEIMDNGPDVTWDDIAGLKVAKSTIKEIVVWPMLRPDIFTGLRGPPKGILLFGPPGTGKTMIGKCIASQSGSTFFSISASSLTSKWVGEGEKMVRAMFAVARCHQPAVIFIDEIDSLLTQRSDSEHESSRRIKTEFLVQLDGATTGSEERLLVVGATNRPQELDEAARRRLVKKLYIPLPDAEARQQIVEKLMVNQNHMLVPEEIDRICNMTDGYSGADMANLCREAALGPIRSISLEDIEHISVEQVRPITVKDFTNALSCIKASVSDGDLHMYEHWNQKFGISTR